MYKKQLIMLMISLPIVVLHAQTYADQQSQYRSYQAQHLATVRAYSVPNSTYSSPAYKSTTNTTNNNSNNSNKSTTVKSTTTSNSNYSAYANPNIKSWGSDDYEDYIETTRNWKPANISIEPKSAAFYSGSKGNNFQGENTETLIAKNNIFIYTGNTLNGIPNGKGEIKWKEATYTGEVKNGLPNGNGSIVYKNGVKHTGTYIDGQFDGKGFMDYADGVTFKGSFTKGLLSKGFIQYPNGMTYDGHFLNGEFDGLGELKYSETMMYNGQFKKGNYEGEGVLKIKETIISGNFRNNRAYYGTIRYPSGNSFTGYLNETKETILPIIGEQHDTNYTYSGSFDDKGKRSGYGYYVDTNGSTMEGNWQNGDLTGVGMYTYANKQIVKGKVNYKGTKIFGYVSHDGKWYPGKMNLNGLAEFIEGGDTTEYDAAFKEADDFLISGRKFYNEKMSNTP